MEFHSLYTVVLSDVKTKYGDFGISEARILKLLQILSIKDFCEFSI